MIRACAVPVLFVLFLLSLSSISKAAADPLVPFPDPRVRVMSPALGDAFKVGMKRSATFRAIVDEIEASNVVVYLVAETQMETRAAHVGLLGAGGGRRYVKVSVDPRYKGCTLVGLIGHELQHAAEIAADPSVDSVARLRALYQRIGFLVCEGSHECFDTNEAVEAGRLIEAEMTAGPGR